MTLTGLSLDGSIPEDWRKATERYLNETEFTNFWREVATCKDALSAVCPSAIFYYQLEDDSGAIKAQVVMVTNAVIVSIIAYADMIVVSSARFNTIQGIRLVSIGDAVHLTIKRPDDAGDPNRPLEWTRRTEGQAILRDFGSIILRLYFGA